MFHAPGPPLEPAAEPAVVAVWESNLVGLSVEGEIVGSAKCPSPVWVGMSDIKSSEFMFLGRVVGVDRYVMRVESVCPGFFVLQL